MRPMILSLLAGAALICGGTGCAQSVTPSPSKASEAPIQVSSFETDGIEKFLTGIVETGEVVGASALVFKDGQEVYFGAHGLSDRESGRVWDRDTLTNIYSMTKPVTGVTLMSLFEDGLFKLDDPLHTYLPEYEDVTVYTGKDEGGNPVLAAPDRPITVRDIMRHTAGFTYGWSGTPVDRAFAEADLFNVDKPIAQFTREHAQIPLAFQPGTQWRYSVGVDVQARLAEVLADKPYGDLVRERVLDPLDMSETGYFVPQDQKSRVSAVYIRGEDGTLNREPDPLVYGFYQSPPTQINGGHGLVATIDDYMRFARMLLGEGTLGTAEILKPETVRLMARDHLPEGITEKDFLPGKGQVGFGLDFAVRIAPPVNAEENPGEVGEFFWDGRASTLFWVDPKNDLAAVLFVQVVPFDGTLHYRFRKAVYDAMGE